MELLSESWEMKTSVIKKKLEITKRMAQVKADYQGLETR